MDKKRLEEDIIALVFSLFFFAFMYFFISPNLTGFVIYEPSYSYNVSEINTTNGLSIKAIENSTTITTTTVYSLQLSSATVDGNDELDDVKDLDNKKKTVDKKDVFNVTFNGTLGNNDILTFKTDDGSGVYTYLCNGNCISPGNGGVNLTGEGIYSITLGGLNEGTSSLLINTSDKVKFNHVNATYSTTITNTIVNYYYPTYPIEIVTEDIEPANLSSFDSFIRNDSLNGQNISYQYSIDSGSNWITMPDDNNLTGINSTKIKIKTIMQSDGSGTPYVYSLSVNYTELISNYTGNSTNSTENNSTNTSQTNSTESNSTNSSQSNSTGSGSGGSTSSSGPASTQSNGISARERAARTAASAPAPSAPASNPAPSAPTQSASQPITGRVISPTGQAIKVEDKFTKENSIVAKVIIGSIALLVLITIALTVYEYKKRKALKGQIKK